MIRLETVVLEILTDALDCQCDPEPVLNVSPDERSGSVQLPFCERDDCIADGVCDFRRSAGTGFVKDSEMGRNAFFLGLFEPLDPTLNSRQWNLCLPCDWSWTIPTFPQRLDPKS